mgnify:CR=1 FL=1
MKRNRSMLFHPGLYGETLRQLRLMGSIYLVLCVVFTLVWARIAAVFANKAQPRTLNRATGVVLVVLGAVILGVGLFR